QFEFGQNLLGTVRALLQRSGTVFDGQALRMVGEQPDHVCSAFWHRAEYDTPNQFNLVVGDDPSSVDCRECLGKGAELLYSAKGLLPLLLRNLPFTIAVLPPLNDGASSRQDLTQAAQTVLVVGFHRDLLRRSGKDGIDMSVH